MLQYLCMTQIMSKASQHLWNKLENCVTIHKNCVTILTGHCVVWVFTKCEHYCDTPEVDTHKLGACDGGVRCSGSLTIFWVMPLCLFSSLQPPSFPLLWSPFSLFCLHSFSARDMNTSRSNIRSLCLTGRDSKESQFAGWGTEEVDESGWESWGRKNGSIVGGAVWGEGRGSGDVGDEGKSKGGELEEAVTGGSGLSLSSA